MLHNPSWWHKVLLSGKFTALRTSRCLQEPHGARRYASLINERERKREREVSKFQVDRSLAPGVSVIITACR